MTDHETALAESLGALPTWPDAECHGLWYLFDGRSEDSDEDLADVAYRHQAAARLCAICPSLDDCRTWLAGLPGPAAKFARTNVIAGRVPRPCGRPRGNSAKKRGVAA